MQQKEELKYLPVTGTLALCPQVTKANAINKAIVSWQLWAFLEGKTNSFTGLKLELIKQARFAVLPCSPQGPGGVCRWLFEPWLFFGTNLTNPGKTWQEPHPCSELVQGEGGCVGLRRGRTMGMLLSQYTQLQACDSSLGRGSYAAFSVCQSQRDCRRMREGQAKCFTCMLKAFCYLTVGS